MQTDCNFEELMAHLKRINTKHKHIWDTQYTIIKVNLTQATTNTVSKTWFAPFLTRVCYLDRI